MKKADTVVQYALRDDTTQLYMYLDRESNLRGVKHRYAASRFTSRDKAFELAKKYGLTVIRITKKQVES